MHAERRNGVRVILRSGRAHFDNEAQATAADCSPKGRSQLQEQGPCLRSQMVNGLHLYSAFIQSALQFLPLIHPFTHTFTHQRRLAAMQGTNQLVRSNWGLGVLLRDTSTRPGWDRTSNPPTARRQLYLLSQFLVPDRVV